MRPAFHRTAKFRRSFRTAKLTRSLLLSIAILSFCWTGVIAQQRTLPDGAGRPAAIAAAPGDLDPTFDGDGRVTTFTSGVNYVWDVGIKSDGSIVTAGTVYGQGAVYAAVFRYLSSGAFDVNYGGLFNIKNLADANALAPQSDGKVVAVGQADNKILIMRLSADGVSTDFSLVDPNAPGQALAVAVQTDGKIVVGGYTLINGNQKSFTIIRYNANGTRDTGFGTSGLVRVTFTAGNDEVVTSLKIDTAGRIIAAGRSSTSTQTCVFARLQSANGGLDSSFGTGGKLELSIGGDGTTGNGSVTSISLLPNNKIVATIDPNFIVGNNHSFILLQLNTDGTRDNSFGGNGTVATIFGSALASAIQSDGKIVVGGDASGFGFARYLPNGLLDCSFGIRGRVTVRFASGLEYLTGLTLQSDGKIVGVGHSNNLQGTVKFALTRLLGGVGTNRCSPADFDGDGLSDISVYRPSAGTWYLLRSQSGFTGVPFGAANDLIAPGDFDGDGKTDTVVFRPSVGTWYLINSSTGTFSAVPFGSAEDLPIPGDFDNDGKSDLCVFRPSNGTWYRLNSSNGAFVPTQFGASGDKPQPGDYDGDGTSDLAVFRPSAGVWYILNSWTGSVSGLQFGASGDLPVPADYDGDLTTDVAVYRPAAGAWYLIQSATGTLAGYNFGIATDLPTPGDYDGDGKADISVFRPNGGFWYRLNSSNGAFLGYQFGANGDKPVPNAYVR